MVLFVDMFGRLFFIGSFRVYVVIVIVICIFVVDFVIFFWCFVKVEIYGSGLMDMGVGVFIFFNVIVL